MNERFSILSALKLSKIHISESEIRPFSEDLSRIFDFISHLDQCPTSHILPTSQVTGIENIFREDDISIFEDPKILLEASSFSREKNLLKIPKIL